MTSANSDKEDTGRATPQTLHRRKVAMLVLGGVFLFIALVWGLYWLIWDRFAVYTDDAYVQGNLVQLMSQVPGKVIEINTDYTYLVEQGQVLVKLDPVDRQIALQYAKATLAQTVRAVRQQFENAKKAQATLILRNADLMKAQLDLKRRTGLLGERAISRETLQHYQTSFTVAKAQYDDALHSLRAAMAIVENSHLYTHPDVERAKANLKTAYLNLQRTTIVAPVTGFVAKRTVQIGQQVALNTPLLAIVPLNEVWVDANYKETQLSKLRINQPVTLYADAYDDVTYHGRVVGLNAGTGASFSLLPPQNATGNWIKIVQRLPVRISLDPKELRKYPLLVGLSMRVTVDVHDTSGPRLAALPTKKIIYATDVYANQLADADSVISTILQDNAPDMFMPRTDVETG